MKGAGAAASMAPAQLGAPTTAVQPTWKVAGAVPKSCLLYCLAQLNPSQVSVLTLMPYWASGRVIIVAAGAGAPHNRNTAAATHPQSWYEKRIGSSSS